MRATHELEDGPEDVAEAVDGFRSAFARTIERWREELDRAPRNGRAARSIWGAGSKGVAFLTTLELRDEIELVVDINPHKHGKFMAGTGQEIVAPERLTSTGPTS